VGHGPLCPAVEEERGDLGLRNAYGLDRLGCGPLAHLLTSMVAAAELRPIA